MNFSNVKDNDRLVDKLKKTILSEKLHHAYIIEGSNTIDKNGFAKAFAKAIMCKVEPGVGCDHCSVCKKIEDENHVDILNIYADSAENSGSKKKSVKVSHVNMIIEALSKKPLDGDRNIVIINDMDTMKAETMNKLLKTLEEPNPGSIIMLVIDNPKIMPITILSRCIRLRLNEKLQLKDLEYENEANRLIRLLIDNDYFYLITNEVDSICKKKDSILPFLDTMEIIYRNLLFGVGEEHERFSSEYIYNAVFAIEAAKKRIAQNVNPKYAMKEMALEIGG